MRTWRMAGVVAAALVIASPARAEVVVGEAAPDFTLTDTHGQPTALSQCHGKFVVLEWFNPRCPFVRKHYGSGNMQRLQQRYTGQGVVWLSINSSAAGKEGHTTLEEANAFIQQQGAASTAVLLDPDGRVGHLFGARTTPHLFIINPDGQLIYNGAIDDKASVDETDVATADNYVARARGGDGRQAGLDAAHAALRLLGEILMPAAR